MFGFAEDYDKIVYGLLSESHLFDKGMLMHIYKNDAADAGKVNLTKISWFMPHVLPANGEKLQLYKTIEAK